MIAHFDVDAFYASVAQRDDPALRGKPLAVAGDSRRSVVLTASYEARPFGVRSAMPLYRARALCPQLVVAPPDFPRYREVSSAVFAIFRRGALALEGLSLDEAFVAVAADTLESAVEYAQGVRRAVREEVGLCVSAGVAAQKMVAKIACVERLWGIGPKSQVRLARHGIATIGQIAALSDEDAYRLFGRGGKALRELARGNDARSVSPDRETRSVSSETTFEYDVRDEAELAAALHELAADVAARLREHGLRGATIGVKIKRADFTLLGRQSTVAVPTDDAATIEAAALHALGRAGLAGAAVRLLGVRVASITEEGARQISFL